MARISPIEISPAALPSWIVPSSSACQSGRHRSNAASTFGRAAMARAFASGKPALVEIMTDAEVVHPATVAMLGQLTEGSRDIMIPYYENIAAS